MSAEDLVKGLRSAGGHLPTKMAEEERKRKEREKKRMMAGAKYE